MLTLTQIRQKVNQYAVEYWGMHFNTEIRVNARLTRSLGVYKYRKVNNFVRPVALELSKNLLTRYNDEVIDGVIKHELTHWALSIQNKPFEDGHPVFEKELLRVGAPSTNTITYVGKLYTGVCENCQKIAIETRSMRSLEKYLKNEKIKQKYASNCCKAPIVFGGIKKMESESINQNNKKEVSNGDKAAIKTAPMEKSIESIIIPGKRGITNAQMIPAIKKALDSESKEELLLLKEHYEEAYDSSLKYLNRNYQVKLIQLLK